MKSLENRALQNVRLVVLINLIMLCSCTLYAQSKQAFMVGISEYQQDNKNTPNSWANIHGANDVALLTPTLQKHGFKVTSVVNIILQLYIRVYFKLKRI